MKAIAGRFLRYFFSGTLFIVPLVATAYFIFVSFQWLDNRLNLPYPGLGFAIIVAVITLIFHNYWAVPEAQMAAQKLNFFKNYAITGGLLAFAAFGGGAFSLDGRRR